jgi:hypothetical protein
MSAAKRKNNTSHIIFGFDLFILRSCLLSKQLSGDRARYLRFKSSSKNLTIASNNTSRGKAFLSIKEELRKEHVLLSGTARVQWSAFN